MKHLIIKDHKLSCMVYFRPKDKAKMYEIIFKSQQVYNRNKDKYTLSLLPYIISKLQLNGFKVVDMTEELKDCLNVYKDLGNDYLMYKGIKIYSYFFGYGFELQGTFTTTKTFEEVIKIIDKEVE